MKPLSDRFWSKVKKGDGCWEWTANRHRQGYGFFKIGGKHGRNVLAHRVSYELEHAVELGCGDVVLHKCDNPSCVRPDHLSLGTQADNVADMANKGRHRGASRLTDAQVKAIMNDGRVQLDIEREYGISGGTVSRIKSGKIYSRVFREKTE